MFVTIGSVTLAAAFVAFTWAMQRRQLRKGRRTADSDDAVIGTLYVP